MAGRNARTRLRDAALELFGRRGIEATSTRSILAAAGLRNPSAINYHFGSKQGLVEDLVGDLIQGTAPVLQLQAALVEGGRSTTVAEWAAVAVDSAIELISTERGRLLARLWWEYDGVVHPHALEKFLGSGSPIAREWQEAVRVVFPDLPPLVAVTRNMVMLRTLEWMIARRAGRILAEADGKPPAVPVIRADDPDVARRLMLEIAVAILSAPTTLDAQDITVV
jgi:AcrR family transcriptional regulator